MHYYQKQPYELKINGKLATKNQILLNMKAYFDQVMMKRMPHNFLNVHSCISDTDLDRQKFSKCFEEYQNKEQFNPQQVLQLTLDQSRSIAAFLGCAIGDALGASTQFQDFVKDRQPYWIQKSFADLKKCIQSKQLHQRHGQFAIWTDDCSMAISMGDSLLLNDFKFDPIHIRYMFIMWLRHGLGNGGRQHSIGLGGNISISMGQFATKQEQYTDSGDKFNSGNGSLMRLAPIPITFRKNVEQAANFAYLQSKTTHNGDQAAQCSRLMATIIVDQINRGQKNWRIVLEQTCKNFKSDIKSVQFLAKSQKQTIQIFEQAKQNWGSKYTRSNKSIQDRNWNWKDEKFTYSETRLDHMPGYIGSYCMDALSMALHIIWHRQSFNKSVIWAVNMGGDCDTVGSIVGQIAGSIYGFNKEVFSLYKQMQDFTKRRYEIFLLAYKLTKRINLEKE